MQSSMRSLSAWMLAAGLLTATAASHAQSTGLNTSAYVLPQLSVYDPDNDFGVKGTGPGVGLRFGMPLAEEWDLQVALSHARLSKNGQKVEQTLIGADALYMFSRSEFRPFVSVGLGAQRDRRTLAIGQSSGTSPYLSAGVGFQWMFSDSFGLQLDYRRVEGFMKKDVWGFKHGSNNYINLGLMWVLDPQPQSTVAMVPPPPTLSSPPPPQPFTRPAPPPPPPPAPPPPPPQKITLESSSLFALNSARIMPPQPELDNFAAALQTNPQIGEVVVTGHTDQLGSPSINARLSQERADAVKAYLVAKGVAANRLTARGVGSTQLVTNCQLPTRAAMIQCGTQNRRVDIEPITISKR